MEKQKFPPMSMPLSVPLIGSQPPPEAVEQSQRALQNLNDLWPLTPFPISGNGLQVPGYWMGQTLLDAFALKILEGLDVQKAASNGAPAMEALAKRMWSLAMYCMELRPVGVRQKVPNQEEADASGTQATTSASTGTDGPPPESSEPASGPRLVTP